VHAEGDVVCGGGFKSCSSSYLTCTIQSDPESYAGSSVAAGRASRARQVKGVDPDKKGIPCSSRFRVGRGANKPTP